MGYFVYKTKKSPLNVILNQARLKWNKYRIRELMVKEFFTLRLIMKKDAMIPLAMARGLWLGFGLLKKMESGRRG